MTYDSEEPDEHAGDHDNHDDMADFLDHFATAIIALRDLALNVKIKPAEIKKRAKFERRVADSQVKLASVEADAAAIVARAEDAVKEIHAQAQARLAAVEAAEAELEQREKKLTAREQSWRGLGEPADVLSGFRSPEFSPLQKARLAHGLPAGRDPDLLGLSQPAEPTVRIDAISDTHDDPRADRHGAPFLGELTRDVSHHKRGAA
jgi:hypothetical protein